MDPDEEQPVPEDLRTQQELKGALHEVANALTAIVGWVDRLQRDHASLETALPIVDGYARRAVRIARQAIGAEVDPMEPRPLGVVVREAVAGVEPIGRARRVPLRIALDSGAELALVPMSDHLVQVLFNLLHNAASIVPGDTEVRIACRATPSRVTIIVEDDGPGLPEGTAADLANGVESTREGGAGVGLRHAHALASQAGGGLRLLSSERGARFEVLWATCEADSVPPPTRPSDDFSGLIGQRILVVEDDRSVIELLDLALSARGAEVVAASDRLQMERALARGPYRAVLLDISPLAEDLEGAVALVRSRAPRAAVVLISGSASMSASFPRVDRWVRKPFDVSEILEALSEASRAEA